MSLVFVRNCQNEIEKKRKFSEVDRSTVIRREEKRGQKKRKSRVKPRLSAW
jgi:hypothetical protein